MRMEAGKWPGARSIFRVSTLYSSSPIPLPPFLCQSSSLHLAEALSSASREERNSSKKRRFQTFVVQVKAEERTCQGEEKKR
jgi:hypothetical protein